MTLALFFQGKDVIEIEKQLNGDFTNICEWFVDNRISIHFGKDQTTFKGHILRLNIR